MSTLDSVCSFFLGAQRDGPCHQPLHQERLHRSASGLTTHRQPHCDGLGGESAGEIVLRRGPCDDFTCSQRMGTSIEATRADFKWIVGSRSFPVSAYTHDSDCVLSRIRRSSDRRLPATVIAGPALTQSSTIPLGRQNTSRSQSDSNRVSTNDSEPSADQQARFRVELERLETDSCRSQ